MNALVMVQALFKKAWVPTKDLALGLPSNLAVCEKPDNSKPQYAKPESSVEQNLAHLRQGIEQKPKIAPVSTLPNHNQPVPAEKKSPVQTSSQVEHAPKPVAAKPALAVSGMEQFHIAATMIYKGLGIVIALPHQYAALSGSDYVMLSKLIAAVQQKRGLSPQPIEFEFFHWPPKQGLASSLQDPAVSLQALKGFLHKMAYRQQSSWIILDEQLARFCFQKPEMKEFDCVERNQHKLLAAPSISRLHSSSELKKQLWLKLSQDVIYTQSV